MKNNNNLQQQLQKLIPIINNLSLETNKIGTSFQGKKGSEIKLSGFVFLDLMSRINANLEALLLLLKKLAVSDELKSPIALLLRACLSDVLTGYYLYTYMKDEQTFENEVKVLGLDFTGYLIAMAENESFLSAKHLSESDRGRLILDLKNQLAQKYSDTIKSVDQSTGKVEKFTRAEIRNTSDPKYLLNGESIKDQITDEKKYKRLRNFEDLENVSYVYILMRYYAQFQHYSFYNREVSKIDVFNNFPFFVQTFFYITGAVLTFGKLIEAEKDQLEKVEKLLEKFVGFRGLTKS